MDTLIKNTNPKHNPFTTIFAVLFFTIAFMLFVIPYFIETKQPVMWWTPLLPAGVGLIFLFMNDDYFNRLFNRADKVVGKKTDTE